MLAQQISERPILPDQNRKVAPRSVALGLGPLSLFLSAWRNRVLIAQLSKREIQAKYRGSFLGIVWSLFQPILMLAVYTFVFSVVFEAKWGERIDSRVDFAVVLFCGLIVYGFFSECINRSPGLILSCPTYVKKVVFPLEILAWVAICSALFQLGASLTILILVNTYLSGSISWQILLFPLVILPLILFTVGLSWILSSLGVYLRDVGQVVGVITSILLFVSPVFFPVEAIPASVRPLFELNPLSYFIEESRAVLLWNNVLNPVSWSVAFITSLIVAWLGFVWFQKTRKGFADVI